MKSKIKLFILICFFFLTISCVSTSNSIRSLECWKVSELNTTYNDKYINQYRIEMKFCYYFITETFYDTDKEGIILFTPGGYQIGNLEKDIYQNYIQNNPAIKYQTQISDLCIFVFTKFDNNKFYLTDIENLNYNRLLYIQEKVENENLIYRDGYYGQEGYFFRKINNTIQSRGIEFEYYYPPFYHNNPYGFSNDCYYFYEDNWVRIIQWIDKESCIINFAPPSYQVNEAYAYIVLDDQNAKNPNLNGRNVAFKYEGVYSYISSWGQKKILPKFRIISCENMNEDENQEPNIKNIGYISNTSSFFIQNTPYGLDENMIYEDAKSAQPCVLQWLGDGCLLDYNNPHVSEIYWDCFIFIMMSEDERFLLFNKDYNHFYKYIGVYEYITTTGVKNTIPKFKVFFQKKQ